MATAATFDLVDDGALAQRPSRREVSESAATGSFGDLEALHIAAVAETIQRLSLSILRPVRSDLSFQPFIEPDEWSTLLRNLEAHPVGLPAEQARAVRQAWTDLRAAIGPSLPLPRVQGGEEGELKFAWSSDRFYAELEIHEDTSHEWFFRDRERDVHNGSAGPEPGAVPGQFLSLLGAVSPG